jgi:hypothetical protein
LVLRAVESLDHFDRNAGGVEIGIRLEDDRPATAGPGQTDLCPVRNFDGHQIVRGQSEGEVHGGRRGRIQCDAYQLQELAVILFRHLVEPPQQHVADPGKELDHGNAGIAVVVIGPLRRVSRNAAAQFRHNIGVGAVIEYDIGQHYTAPSVKYSG